MRPGDLVRIDYEIDRALTHEEALDTPNHGKAGVIVDITRNSNGTWVRVLIDSGVKMVSAVHLELLEKTRDPV